MRTLLLACLVCCTSMVQAQIDRGGTVSGHTTVAKPTARFIVGQPFAGRTTGATLGFLPLAAGSPSSVSTETATAGLMVAPLPARDLVTLSVDACAFVRTYTLYDGEGRQGLQGTIGANVHHTPINLAMLLPGTYSLVVRTGARMELIPVVIVR